MQPEKVVPALNGVIAEVKVGTLLFEAVRVLEHRRWWARSEGIGDSNPCQTIWSYNFRIAEVEVADFVDGV